VIEIVKEKKDLTVDKIFDILIKNNWGIKH